MELSGVQEPPRIVLEMLFAYRERLWRESLWLSLDYQRDMGSRKITARRLGKTVCSICLLQAEQCPVARCLPGRGGPMRLKVVSPE